MIDHTYRKHRLPRGDTWTVEVEIPGNDLSGWTWACQWRPQPSSGTVFASATVDMTNAATGLVAFTVPSAVTGTIIPPETYFWDIQRTASGYVETVVEGEVHVYWDVTR